MKRCLRISHGKTRWFSTELNKATTTKEATTGNGLWLPALHLYDENDFADKILSKYKISVRLGTQDRVNKFFQEGVAAFNAKE